MPVKSAGFRAKGPLPADLGPYLPSEESRKAVQRALEHRGFSVYTDSMGVALTIKGPPALFAKVFGLKQAQMKKLSATETRRLQPPEEVMGLVEEVSLLPPPEMFHA